ncbi:MAG: prephenate dehydrogenase [Spirochaetes bacterium]|nr:prephenate dehydrogenase [Spirochaetota bacterium]
MFNKVAIIGLGLIGGSIARMLKKKHQSVHITAYGRKPENLHNAIKEGFIDDVASIDAIDCNDVDLFIVATPVLSSIAIIKSLLDDPHLKSSALIIDAGSVKQSIIDSVIEHQKAHQFVGCHPMAGSEKSGYTFSTHSILTGAWVIITPHKKNNDDDIAIIKKFWELLECKIHITDAVTHDRMVASTSHFPHIVSTVLMESFFAINKENNPSDIQPFIGKGFKDMTRLAGGSPDMWSDIVLLNNTNIIAVLEDYIQSLNKVKHRIQQASLHNDRDVLCRYFEEVQKKWIKYHA